MKGWIERKPHEISFYITPTFKFVGCFLEKPPLHLRKTYLRYYLA